MQSGGVGVPTPWRRPPGRDARRPARGRHAVAARVTTGDLYGQAVRDLGGFVDRTVVGNDTIYAVRIDDGVLLDASEQIHQARRHVSAADEAAAAFGLVVLHRYARRGVHALALLAHTMLGLPDATERS